MKTGRISILSALIVVLMISACQPKSLVEQQFDPDRAYADLQAQMNYGYRIPGTDSHEKVFSYIQDELQKAGWKVEIQDLTYEGHPVKNITAKRSNTDSPIILAAHYDTRMVADHDPDENLRSQPVPGANDGASGVSVLLEIARVLPDQDKNVWLVFFDTEDQGHIMGWDWILGSQVYAENLQVIPRAVIVIDMIGDADLNIYREKNSDPTLTDQIWQSAKELGFENKFIDEEKYSMLDDHTAFLDKGIPAVDIIDFDYPYWHTTQDTTDKVSPESLMVIGNTLLRWLTDNLSVGK